MNSLGRIAILAVLVLAGAGPAAGAEPGEAAAGEAAVPAAVLEAARAALAAQLAHGGVAARPVLAAAEAVTWPDGGLGCARPGAARTQALVPGYRLVFSAAGRRYEVHAAAAGAVVVCPRRGPRALLPPVRSPTAPQ